MASIGTVSLERAEGNHLICRTEAEDNYIWPLFDSVLPGQ